MKMNQEKVCYFKNNKLDENGKIIKKSMGIIPTICNHLLDVIKIQKKAEK